MNLRWYQIIDENGEELDLALQQYNAQDDYWFDVPFVRERGYQEEED